MTTTTVQEIPLEQLAPNPWQPRLTIVPETIQDLADNIHAVGLLQRPLIRPAADGMYQLAFGHQRVAAIQVLKERGDWPGDVPVEIRELSDEEMAVIALSENAKRRDLTPLEQYRAYQKALNEIPGLNNVKLAELVGIDHSTLSNNLRILALPHVVLERVESGELSGRGAREFLCLMGQDHAHTNIMESIIQEVAQGAFGSPSDWRVGNMRRLIRDRITGSRVTDWRRLGGSNRGFFGGSHQTSPSFDIDAFKKEFSAHVHLIPWDGGEDSSTPMRPGHESSASLAWTCNVTEWGKWQTQASAAAGEGTTQKPVPKSQAHLMENGAFQRGDPVARQLLGQTVSRETLAQQVADELKGENLAGILKSTTDAEIAKATTDAEEPVPKAEAYQHLNTHLTNFLRSHIDQEARDNLRHGRGTNLPDNLKLSEVLSEMEIARAVENFIDRFEERLEKAAEGNGPGKLTKEQREALGTRAEVVHMGFNRRGHPLNEQEYNGPPSYFPDLSECRSKCTWGATYVTKYSKDEKPTLYCLNEDHWQEKLQRGKEAYAKQLLERTEAEDREDMELATAITGALPGGLAATVSAALLASQGEYRPYVPENLGRMEEFAYEPATIEEVRKLLGLEKPDRFYSLSVKDALAALPEVSEDRAREVAAQLVVWSLRRHGAAVGYLLEQLAPSKNGATQEPTSGGWRYQSLVDADGTPVVERLFEKYPAPKALHLAGVLWAYAEYGREELQKIITSRGIRYNLADLRAVGIEPDAVTVAHPKGKRAELGAMREQQAAPDA